VIARFARAGGIIGLPDPFLSARRQIVGAATLGARVPAIFSLKYFATAGGLISYGINPAILHEHAAVYVDRILRGTPVGELPVQAPSRFEMVVNLRTARELNLAIPPTLLARADEVIE
jgi:putative ABC transport system substrate-binding protein